MQLIIVAQVVPVQPVAQVQVPLVQVAPFKQKSVILQGFEFEEQFVPYQVPVQWQVKVLIPFTHVPPFSQGEERQLLMSAQVGEAVPQTPVELV